jgi:Fe-Mn family superoxide dismutase
MWEHAYYLQYLTEKKDWVAAFWKMVNWEDVAGAMSVRSLDLLL